MDGPTNFAGSRGGNSPGRGVEQQQRIFRYPGCPRLTLSRVMMIERRTEVGAELLIARRIAPGHILVAPRSTQEILGRCGGMSLFVYADALCRGKGACVVRQTLVLEAACTPEIRNSLCTCEIDGAAQRPTNTPTRLVTPSTVARPCELTSSPSYRRSNQRSFAAAVATRWKGRY